MQLKKISIWWVDISFYFIKLHGIATFRRFSANFRVSKYNIRDKMGCQPAFTCSKLTKETLARCEICSKLLKKTSEQDHWRRTVICIVNFGHICCFVLGFLSLILNNLIPAGLNCHWPINAYHSKSAESQFSWKSYSRKGATSWLWFSTRLSWDIFFHPNMFLYFCFNL